MFGPWKKREEANFSWGPTSPVGNQRNDFKTHASIFLREKSAFPMGEGGTHESREKSYVSNKRGELWHPPTVQVATGISLMPITFEKKYLLHLTRLPKSVQV